MWPGGDCQDGEPATASRCWESRSGDCREITSGFGNTAAVGDTDCENGATFNSLFQEQGKLRGVWGGLWYLPGVEQKSQIPGKAGERKNKIAAPCQALSQMLHNPPPAEAHEVVIIMSIMQMRPEAQQGYRLRAPSQGPESRPVHHQSPCSSYSGPTSQLPALPASPGRLSLPLLPSPQCILVL